jgi:hypothetical protein
MPIFKPSLKLGAVILDLHAFAMKLAIDPSPSLLLAGIYVHPSTFPMEEVLLKTSHVAIVFPS